MNAKELIHQLELLEFVIGARLEPEPHDVAIINAAINYIKAHEQIVRVNQQIAQEE